MKHRKRTRSKRTGSKRNIKGGKRNSRKLSRKRTRSRKIRSKRKVSGGRTRSRRKMKGGASSSSSSSIILTEQEKVLHDEGMRLEIHKKWQEAADKFRAARDMVVQAARPDVYSYLTKLIVAAEAVAVQEPAEVTARQDIGAQHDAWRDD